MANDDDKGTTIYTDDMYYKHTSDEENVYSYQFLGKQLGLSNIELFTITVLIGKYVVKSRDGCHRACAAGQPTRICL